MNKKDKFSKSELDERLDALEEKADRQKKIAEKVLREITIKKSKK